MILLGKLNFLWLTLRPVQYVMKFTSERAWKQVVCLVRWGYRHRKKYSVAKWKMRSFWDQLSHQNHCTGEFISISSFFSSRNKVTDFIYKLQIWEATGKRLKSDVGSSPKSLTSWMTLKSHKTVSKSSLLYTCCCFHLPSHSLIPRCNVLYLPLTS